MSTLPVWVYAAISFASLSLLLTGLAIFLHSRIQNLKERLGQPLELNYTFVGEHFLVLNLYQKQQKPGAYDGLNLWILEAATEVTRGRHFFVLTEKQYQTLKGQYDETFILKVSEYGPTNEPHFYFEHVPEEKQVTYTLKSKAVIEYVS